MNDTTPKQNTQTENSVKASTSRKTGSRGYDIEIKKLDVRLAKLEKSTKDVRILALDRGVQDMVQELFRHIVPVDPVGHSFERVGRDYDGGYIMVKIESASRIAYSLGINRDVSWDMEMAERGYSIYQYDHTIPKLPTPHPNFHFKRKGITGKLQMTDELSSLEREIIANGHQDSRDITLKIDIEGYEWEVFSEMSVEDLSRFSQILVECHSLTKVNKLFWYRKALQALRNLSLTHKVVHVHGNNNSPMVVLGGVAVPQTIELTLLRNDICRFSPCTRTFPTSLDQPNNPNYADHRLGMFSFF